MKAAVLRRKSGCFEAQKRLFCVGKWFDRNIVECRAVANMDLEFAE